MPRGYSTFANELEIVIPITDLINVSEELGRIESQIAKMTLSCGKLKKKLNNKNFRLKAPAEVMEREEAKLADQLSIIDKLTKRKQTVEELA